MERHGSVTLADRRLPTPGSTNGGTPEPLRRSSRISISPIGTTTRSSRSNVLPPGVGKSGSCLSVLDSQHDVVLETPSPTATRLRALAKSVRAANILDVLKARNRYMASAPMAAAGSASQSIEPQTPTKLMVGHHSPSATSMAARVIMLPTHEFSTAEMKFRLDPLEPATRAVGSTAAGDATASASTSTILHGGVVRSDRPGSSAKPVTATTTLTTAKGAISSKSRWKAANVKAINGTVPLTSSNNHNDANRHRRGPIHSAGTRFTKRSSGTNFASDDDATAGNSHHVNIEARLCCARSFYKLSCQAGCELAIIRGGAIAQLAECSDIEHLRLHELCAATLANLTTDPLAIDAFVADDGIPALLELSWSPSIKVKLLCATALCRLSSRSAHAAALARARASIEFLAMLSLPSEHLQQLAISCLVNLMYYGHSFPDRIFLGEPHAIQNQLGILSITSQLALAPPTMEFAAEVLFNLALYRTSCSSVLRGGGADVLHGLAVHVGKTLDEHHTIGMSTNLVAQHTPRLTSATALILLRFIADTVANFSVHLEFQASTSGSTMKTLTLMLQGALRDLGSRFYGGLAEERLRILAVPCSRTLANLSSSDEQRRQGFTSDMVQLTTRLFLVHRRKLFSASSAGQHDQQTFARNILRAVVNLSFYEPCATQLMEFPDVMARLTRVVLRSETDEVEPDDRDDEGEGDDNEPSDDSYEDEYEDEDDAPKHPRCASAKSTSTTDVEPTEPVNAAEASAVDKEMREDALVAILNLAQQGAYTLELLKHLDGKKLAQAADDLASGSRLKYIYDVVLCNLLFESRLQQLLYGDLVVASLIDGFYFFAPSLSTGGATASGADPFSTDDDCGSHTAHAFQRENLAFPDDQERFLVAIVNIAGEIMDPRNVDRLVTLVLDCLRPMDTTMTLAHRTWRRHITGYASAVLYTLARLSATRGDAGSNRIYAPETVQALIDLCEGKPTAAATAPGACDNMMTSESDLGMGQSAATFSYCAFAQAFSAATLYHICATGHFTPRVIQALVSACNANEESLSLLACSAAFAIISFTPEGRQQLVATAHLAKALNRLGRTSHVECQQYAAIAACNVSTVHCMWSSHELKDFIVVALLRANSWQAKQIHAKTLANLLSHIKTRAKAVDDGVLYALMKLSQVVPPIGTDADPALTQGTATATSPAVSSRALESTDKVFHLGLQVLFNLSCEHPYHAKLMGNGVITYLATAVTSGKPASSTVGKEALLEASASPPLTSSVTTDSRRYAMGIICNLSSYESNHKELMNAQVIDMIRSYVDYDLETRASAAMAVRNLSCRQPWVELICERRTLHMLITFTHCDHAVVRHFAIQALANCSQVTDSLHLFGELKVTRAVMAVLDSIRPPGASVDATTTSRPPSSKAKIPLSQMATLSPTDSRETSMAALKCLHNVAFDDALAQNLMDESAILRLQPFMESRELDTSEDACVLAATMLSVLAGKPRCADALLRQRVVAFCALLHRRHPLNPVIAYETCLLLAKLSTYQPIQAALTETQAIQVVVAICTSSCATTDDRIRECGVIAIRNLALCVAEHELVFYNDAGCEEHISPVNKGGVTNNPPTLAGDRRDGHPRGRTPTGSSVSRLMERHLMQGVQYIQQEIERCLPVPQGQEDSCTAMSEPIDCSSTTERILIEACAGLTNLSTVKSFRIEMVRANVVTTLLHLLRASRETPRFVVPRIVQSMCSATLHRLALEEEATVDGHGLLVPSLLEILYQSDEALHHVRYECEKVSLPPTGSIASRPPIPRYAHSTKTLGKTAAELPLIRHDHSTNASTHTLLPSSPLPIDAAPTALIATTTCIKQNYREPKWITYVVKAMLSSASMVPPIEKKHIRAIGQPKLSFFDMDSSTLFADAASPPSQQAVNGERDGAAVVDEQMAKRKGGYLLPVHMDKSTIQLTGCLEDGEAHGDNRMATAFSCDDWRPQSSTSRSSASAASPSDGNVGSHDREGLVHSRKFDQHMRLTRRNHRRTKMLPALSFM